MGTKRSITEANALTYREQPSCTGRLGIITARLPFGFGETFLTFELQALADIGFELTIFPVTARSKKNCFADLTASVVRFSLLSPATLICALKGLSMNLKGALKALITILVAQGSIKSRLQNLALFPTGLSLAYEARRRKLTHIHAYWLTGAATAAFVASQVAGLTWSYTAHSYDIFMVNSLIVEKTKHAKFGRTVSELGKKAILRRLGTSRWEKLHVVHLGICVARENRKIPTPRSSRPFHLLCPAELIRVKGHTYLLEALKMVTDNGLNCRCLFAGEGNQRRALERKVKTLNLGRVVSMPGIVPHSLLLQRLESHAYDAVVLPSIELGPEFEGIPFALIEAMNAGVPCIATDTGAISELIDKSCGILVKQKDADDLCRAITRLATDPDLRTVIVKNGMNRVRESYDSNVSALTLSSLILDSRPPT